MTFSKEPQITLHAKEPQVPNPWYKG